MAGEGEGNSLFEFVRSGARAGQIVDANSFRRVTLTSYQQGLTDQVLQENRGMTSILLAAASLLAQIPEVSGPVTAGPALQWIDVAEGTGAPAAAGMRYTVHYTGWLDDGTKFDSSRDRDEPFSFVQGKRRVIPGFDLGFEGMRVGGKRRILIPQQMAYGEKGSGPIPPRSDLTFDVELLAVAEPPNVLPAQDVLQPLGELEVGLRAAGLENLLADVAALRKEMEAASAGLLAREVTLDGVQTTQMGVYIRKLMQLSKALGAAKAAR